MAGGRRFDGVGRLQKPNQLSVWSCLVVVPKVRCHPEYISQHPQKIKVQPWLEVSDVAVLCCRRVIVSLVFSNLFVPYIRRVFLRNRGKARTDSDPQNGCLIIR